MVEQSHLRSVRAAYLATTAKTAAATPGQQELLANLARLGLLSGGAGAAYGVARGLSGMSRPVIPLGSGSNVPTPISVLDPAVLESQTEEKKQTGRIQSKFAGITDNIASALPEPNNANVLTGNSIPLTAAATVLPAVAAYGGIRGLFDKFRKSEQSAALASAKKEYEDALANQYHNVALAKTAEAKEIADAIDVLFEKSAADTMLDKAFALPPLSWAGLDPKNVYGTAATATTGGALGNNASEGWNSLKGMTLAAALASGGMAGKYMYDRSRKTDPKKVMQDALDRRSRQRRTVPNVLTPQLMAENQ